MQTTSRKIRVLVVDDSAVARSVIIQGLSASPRIEVVGYAVNAMDARTKLQGLSPDVMTLDVEMPGINGIDFLKRFLPSHPLPVILVLLPNLRGSTRCVRAAVGLCAQARRGREPGILSAGPYP